MNKILEERGEDYGDFTQQWSLSQRLKSSIRQHLIDKSMDFVSREAIDMIMLKVSRLVVGDEGKLDTWDDIIGYATLARNHHAEFDNCQPDKTFLQQVDEDVGYSADLDGAQERINDWITKLMPDRTPEMALQKLIMEEIPELLNGGVDDPLEWADIFILVLDCATLRDIDLVKAVHDKMDINEKRKWALNDKGVLHHVGDD